MTRLDNTRLPEEERLKTMFYNSGMSPTEIASALNTTTREVSEKLADYDIEWPGVKPHAVYDNRPDGYVRWRGRGGEPQVFVHQLLAIAGGADPHNVFSEDTVVHHKNGIRWDNREENLEAMSRQDHGKLHYERGDFSSPDNRYNDDELLDWIRAFYEEFGIPPTSADFKTWLGPSDVTYRNRFGGIREAVEAAGYSPRTDNNMVMD